MIRVPMKREVSRVEVPLDQSQLILPRLVFNPGEFMLTRSRLLRRGGAPSSNVSPLGATFAVSV